MIITATKLVLETQSPMAINTGLRESGFDNELVRDINGLPMIPATSFAGQLSHHCARHMGNHLKEKWFGTTVQSSTLFISHGKMLDSKGQSVPEYMNNDDLRRDPLLSLCLESRPHHRERVSINDRGVAIDTGKFDQILIPKGVRFEFSLHWTTQMRADKQTLANDEWHQILSLIGARTFALGSNTRNGLGCVTIVASDEKQFDLSQGPQISADFNRYRQQALPNTHGLKTILDSKQPHIRAYRSLRLKALDNWRCGTGSQLLTPLNKQDKENTPDILSYSEPVFEWHNNQASLIPNRAVLCGSSIKGMLAHRIAFHLNRHTKVWAESLADATHAQWQQKPELLKQLLGDSDEQHQNSIAGVLFVDDAPLHYQHTSVRYHNSIDRFTGGVRQGALFSEELLYQPEFTVNLYLTVPREELPEPLISALDDTISDLEQGLLPMGAGSGRGTSLVMSVSQQQGA